MILYPAMDLMGGAVVRLAQGRFDDATFYPADPAQALAGFAGAGATWAHVVDLDGARAGAPVQHDLLGKLAAASPLKLQVAGGIRTADHIARLLDAGVARVVIGSLAVKEPGTVRAFLDRFGPESITLSLDVRVIDGQPMVATLGWTEDSGLTLWDAAAQFPGARHLLVTDIGRDGMLAGPNEELVTQVLQNLPALALQASGGVGDARHLRQLRAAGAAGAIVGKALWEGRLSLGEALDACA
ncbi:MAG TPA: 1-(5-phosphoribosyl)-5-[(5-phosphoribosylamino)methylideneamino] imidazole-4-carboxamide isomerase [Allosphingosinicella sp.]|nr:1-(5-phosphoribosyl)-5-[(5-phosphoribosylamino)methylideneamino] imidazole-4-carboxamide isomerase [Allosphingosinicella sp.]